MKPFNRELAAQGAKLVTRDGRKVIHYHDTKMDIKYPIVAVTVNDDELSPMTFDSNGSFGQCNNYNDLFMATEEEFVAVFEDGGIKFSVVGNQSVIDSIKCKKIKQFPL